MYVVNARVTAGAGADRLLAVAGGEGGAPLRTAAQQRAPQAERAGEAAPAGHAARGGHGGAGRLHHLPRRELLHI